nr:immunoglobulin light chain junction region [Macaca mulatta]MOX48400.1 immunoglobulin light chain junction region [Macaca mulatta]MOX48417.1 immunoglobulin light chain junction region [Macaca mulatta]MOX48632.1 immunoglobulin light chain junction region [Macaca mulatta]MOX48651.1 immunoglobulin light chain junction region [Macaca mulatta]
CQQGNGHPYTF